MDEHTLQEPIFFYHYFYFILVEIGDSKAYYLFSYTFEINLSV